MEGVLKGWSVYWFLLVKVVIGGVEGMPTSGKSEIGNHQKQSSPRRLGLLNDPKSRVR